MIAIEQDYQYAVTARELSLLGKKHIISEYCFSSWIIDERQERPMQTHAHAPRTFPLSTVDDLFSWSPDLISDDDQIYCQAAIFIRDVSHIYRPVNLQR